MKRFAFALLVTVACSGCGLLHTFDPDHRSNGNNPEPPLPAVWTKTGVTTENYEMFWVPSQDRTLTVRVKKPTDSAFQALNNHEYRTDAPTGTFQFKDKAVDWGDDSVTIWVGTPVAPIGTSYEVTSVANTTKSLY